MGFVFHFRVLRFVFASWLVHQCRSDAESAAVHVDTSFLRHGVVGDAEVHTKIAPGAFALSKMFAHGTLLVFFPAGKLFVNLK